MFPSGLVGWLELSSQDAAPGGVGRAVDCAARAVPQSSLMLLTELPVLLSGQCLVWVQITGLKLVALSPPGQNHPHLCAQSRRSASSLTSCLQCSEQLLSCLCRRHGLGLDLGTLSCSFCCLLLLSFLCSIHPPLPSKTAFTANAWCPHGLCITLLNQHMCCI